MQNSFFSEISNLNKIVLIAAAFLTSAAVGYEVRELMGNKSLMFRPGIYNSEVQIGEVEADVVGGLTSLILVSILLILIFHNCHHVEHETLPLNAPPSPSNT